MTLEERKQKLIEVAAQIEKLLADNDMAGSAMLHLPDCGYFLLNLGTSYSIISIEGSTTGAPIIRIDESAGAEDKVYSTVNMLSILGGSSQTLDSVGKDCLAQLSKSFDIGEALLRTVSEGINIVRND